MSIALLIAFVALSHSGDDAPVIDQGRDAAQSTGILFTGMFKERAKLRQGLVRITGSLKDAPEGHKSLEGAVDSMCAFDLDHDVFRFDREQPVRTIKVDGDPFPRRRYSYIKVKDRTFHYVGSSPHIVILDSTHKAMPGVMPFDVRAACLLMPRMYSSGRRLEPVLSDLQKFKPVEVNQEADGICRVVWILANGQHRRSLWIDTSRGFTPIRFEVQDRRLAPGEDNHWPDPYVKNTATWTKLKGVWVPTEFTLRERPPRKSLVYSHTLSWEIVNAAVPEVVFSIEGLGARKGTRVINNLDGQRSIR